MRLKSVGLIAMLVVFCASPRPSDAQGMLNGKQAIVSLCAITQCPPVNGPVIKWIDWSSAVTPGGKVVLQGVNFNSSDGKPGSITLKIGNKAGVTIIQLGQQTYHPPYLERQLTILGWADSHVFGQIPDDIVGVYDGTATVEVARSDGARSAAFIVQFKATQDLVALPPDAMQVQSCSNEPDENLCNNVSDNSALSIPTDLKGAWSVYGEHVMFLQSPKGITWKDTYAFSVKNHWDWNPSDVRNRQGWGHGTCNEGSAAFESSRPAFGQGKVSIRSNVTCNYTYRSPFWIFGPKGVPWR